MCNLDEMIKKWLFCTDLVGMVVFCPTYTHRKKEEMIGVKIREPAAEPLLPSRFGSIQL